MSRTNHRKSWRAKEKHKTGQTVAQLGSKGTDDNVRIKVREANGGGKATPRLAANRRDLSWFWGIGATATDEGLGPTLLNETALLVENSTIPGNFAAPAISAGFQGLNLRDTMERVAEDDRVMEFPFEDGQKRQSIDSRGLTHQTGGDRQTEKPMSDRPTKRAAFGQDVIHMDRVKISGEPREQNNIRLSHRSPRALPLIADDEVIKRQD